MIRLPRLGAAVDAPFPDPATALHEPDGLLAFGGDLAPQRLLNAYCHGIFPWYSAGQPILWWSPDPRMVVAPAELHLSRRFRRWLRRCDWTLRGDTAFGTVIDACADIPREGQDGTWITAEMRDAYLALHALGHAHSVEVYAGRRLVGGIYGVAIGRAFFGESMFGTESGASKVAIAALARQLTEWRFSLLDGQMETPHLASLGFRPLPRDTFLAQCAAACDAVTPPLDWAGAIAALTPALLAQPAIPAAPSAATGAASTI
jgi:leucyl/phenylalanyl-tRNA---protein transferase